MTPEKTAELIERINKLVADGRYIVQFMFVFGSKANVENKSDEWKEAVDKFLTSKGF